MQRFRSFPDHAVAPDRAVAYVPKKGENGSGNALLSRLLLPFAAATSKHLIPAAGEGQAGLFCLHDQVSRYAYYH